MTQNPETASDSGDQLMEPPPVSGTKAGLLAWIARSATTLSVILLLVAAAAIGHYSGWKLPKVSQLWGANAVRDDWCDQHDVPESQCVECHPELAPPPKHYGWCKIHGVHDCTLCHPEVAQLSPPRPVSPDDLARAERALAAYERRSNNSNCQLHLRRIQFASQADVERAGVDIGIAWQGPIVEALVANAEVGYDQTRLVHLASPVPGTIWSVEKDLGQFAKKGEVLALVNAAAVGQAKSEFLQALAQVQVRTQTLERMKKSEGSLAGKQIQEAAAAAHESRVRLLSAQQALVNLGLFIDSAEWLGQPEELLLDRIRFLGVPPELVQRLEEKIANSNLLPLRAPIDSVVIHLDAVRGEFVDTTTSLFTVADTSRMWLLLHVKSEDVGRLNIGQAVQFLPDAQGAIAAGKVTWISTAADEIARTVKVRVELENPHGRLRANTFGAGKIILREEPDAIVVPNEAVHWDGSCHVLFVRDKDFLKKDAFKLFHTRTVRLGVSQKGLTEVIAGVLPGEVVASSGSAVLLAQLLKNNLGAG